MALTSAKRFALEFIRDSGFEIDVRVKKLAHSQSSLRPGDLISFRYPKEDINPRVALIVSCERGPYGSYISTKGNILISCFKLNYTGAVTNEILRNLYKNRSKASYYSIKKSLTTLLGTSSYRTYILNEMTEIHAIEFNRNSLRIDS